MKDIIPCLTSIINTPFQFLSFFPGQITSAAQIIMIFFMIYCPTRVKPYGAYLKDTDGKNNNGVNVHAICTNKNISAARNHFPVISKKPRAHSHTASKIIFTG